MRTKQENRRFSETREVTVTVDGADKKVLITVGFDEKRRPREVFCADWKAGSSMHGMVIDSCILISRLLQHEDTSLDLVKSLCNPPSLVGQIARVVDEFSPGNNPRTGGEESARTGASPVTPGPGAPYQIYIDHWLGEVAAANGLTFNELCAKMESGMLALDISVQINREKRT